jgi:hypothetical protein
VEAVDDEAGILVFLFAKHSTIKDARTYAHTLTPINAHTHTLPL